MILNGDIGTWYQNWSSFGKHGTIYGREINTVENRTNNAQWFMMCFALYSFPGAVTFSRAISLTQVVTCKYLKYRLADLPSTFKNRNRCCRYSFESFLGYISASISLSSSSTARNMKVSSIIFLSTIGSATAGISKPSVSVRLPNMI